MNVSTTVRVQATARVDDVLPDHNRSSKERKTREDQLPNIRLTPACVFGPTAARSIKKEEETMKTKTNLRAGRVNETVTNLS